MSYLLALEWDSREVRIVAAKRQSKSILLEHAFSIERPQTSSSESVAQEEEEQLLASKIAAALSARGISKAETLVSLGRANIELRLLSLPNAPSEELPSLVRFQAAQHFSNWSESWPLDFVPLGQSADGTINVLAAVVTPNFIQQIDTITSQSGFKAEHIVLRPCAAASLVRRYSANLNRVRLLVDLLAEEVDLTVLVDGEVALIRTVRLPGESYSQQQRQALLAEIRRTILAAQNQLSGKKVDLITLCEEPEALTGLKEQIEEELMLEVEILNPFERMQCSPTLKENMPSHPGSLTPLVGMLLDEAEQSPHAIDFLDPRKKQEPVSRWRQYGVPSVLVASLLLIIAGCSVFFQLRSLDQQIQKLTHQRRDWERKIKRTVLPLKKKKEVDRWQAANINWLDKLHLLSEKAPSAEKFVVNQLQCILQNNQTGKILLDGNVDQRSTLHQFKLSFGNVTSRGSLLDTKSRFSDDPLLKEKYRIRYNKISITLDDPLSPVHVGGKQ